MRFLTFLIDRKRPKISSDA